MARPIIRAEGLGKQYSLGEHEAGRHTFGETLSNLARSPFRFLKGAAANRPPQEPFWALSDVSFDVYPGEVVGVIGRNGAGKSTLLKILSRITQPTLGRARMRGRLAALLEVGTGFHGELTGRENVYLNGAILGMTRSEIRRKFDEIVSFAEIERFIDTPVKRYSSGMYLRLAFAVAAHLEPEILIVDEVLAVGDAAFQKKCFGKLDQVSSEGRTVLFVSHNIPAINRLCQRGILLDRGKVVLQDSAVAVTAAYLRQNADSEARPVILPGAAASITHVQVLRESGEATFHGTVEEDLRVSIHYVVVEPGIRFRCAVSFLTQDVCAFSSIQPREIEYNTANAEYRTIVTIPRHLLAEGEYSIDVSLFRSEGVKRCYSIIKGATTLQVIDPLLGTSARGDYVQPLDGVMRPLLRWEQESLSRSST